MFVSPTYAEGFSNTILEAMATGLPVVSTNTTGVVDCLRHEGNALLHEPGDVAGLAATIERMILDEPLRRRLAAQALEEARTLYSWPSVAKQIVGVYESLLDTRPDDSWTAPGPVEPCRFRLQPHLL